MYKRSQTGKIGAFLGGGALLFLGFLLQAPGAVAQNQSPPPTTLEGMQSLYLAGPVLRYYADADPDSLSPLPENLVQLTNLSIGANRQIYLNLNRVRQVVAQDEAIHVFVNDPNVGPVLQPALQQAILYAGLEANPMAGINSYNQLNAVFGNRIKARIAANPKQLLLAPKKRTSANNNDAQSTNNDSNKGTLAPKATTAKAPNADKADKRKFFLQDLQKAQGATINDFTVLVGLSPDKRQATLYVLGSLPETPNPDVPVSFTVEGRTYRQGDADQAGNDMPSNYILVDKLQLPAVSQGARYFCFVYPLTVPDPSTQMDLTVRYWPSPFVSLVQDVALTHSAVSASRNTVEGWMAVPLTRLVRYQINRDILVYALDRTPIGGDIEEATRELLYGQARQRRLQKNRSLKRTSPPASQNTSNLPPPPNR